MAGMCNMHKYVHHLEAGVEIKYTLHNHECYYILLVCKWRLYDSSFNNGGVNPTFVMNRVNGVPRSSLLTDSMVSGI